MSTLTEIEAAVDSLPLAQQKKLFAALKHRFDPERQPKTKGCGLKSASKPGIKGLDPHLSVTGKDEIRELILRKHAQHR